MGVKRKKEVKGNKSKSKRQKKKSGRSQSVSEDISSENRFDVLPSNEDESDSSIVFDADGGKKEPSMVLIDSDNDSSESEDILVQSEDDSGENKNEGTEDKEEITGQDHDREENSGGLERNGLTSNQDFIEFGFESSEDDQGENGEFSDDGVISDGENGKVYSAPNETNDYPWVKNHDHSTQKEIADWLTLEMKDFVNYISPSKEEILTRNRVVKDLKREINSLWPDTETHVFGSSATDLYLPGSDIDMVVTSKTGDYENRSKLYQLSSYLRNRKLAKDIEVIAKAKVPIIKFVDPSSNIHIDISFERRNGIEAAKRIRKWLDKTPGLRELVLIIKQFLRSRRLNNVHVGGLGGYSTIILCYHFLRLHPRISTNNMSILDNLGSLLIEFFELYGRNFSYDNLIIAIDPETDEPKYLPKKDHAYLNSSKNPFSIVIQDPADSTNNISRSSYNLRDVKKAFGGAFQLLVDKCYQLHAASYKGRIGQSILGDIIKYRGKERDFNDDRDKVLNHALIDHQKIRLDTATDEIVDDKYYYSDVTVESDDDSGFVENKKGQKRVSDFMSINGSDDEDESNGEEDDGGNASKKRKISSKVQNGADNKSDREGTGPETSNGSEIESEDRPSRNTSSESSLSKSEKRDYWIQKGSEL
ncbi:Piso0_002176 [Millerozyma farinosa CBS 7064]|uniref:polynucleotide adenylyltransferase n=1 Tax=Pichia sorbitophila (strain ATCC MYA-4447 / BCRC 22081 / CBS 7064 / NBRC 10061 / NRRL Y-12695) TaxID=559304 RepID=G8YEB8_PICSO|nr:Piso0_002176 [Millerozyma farinosa CBS 7064]